MLCSNTRVHRMGFSTGSILIKHKPSQKRKATYLSISNVKYFTCEHIFHVDDKDNKTCVSRYLSCGGFLVQLCNKALTKNLLAVKQSGRYITTVTLWCRKSCMWWRWSLLEGDTTYFIPTRGCEIYCVTQSNPVQQSKQKSPLSLSAAAHTSSVHSAIIIQRLFGP